MEEDTIASQAPLLGRESSSDDGGHTRRDSYGSTSSKDDVVVNVDSTDDGLNINIQDGVRQADAINQVWSKAVLFLAYFFIFLCSFANTLQYQVMSNLQPYVVSEFSAHSLIPTIGIIASIMSGVLKLPIAKLIDSWGRPQGLACMIALATLGLVLMAASRSVRTYAAAEVIYQVGISGFTYVLDIIIADTSSLKDRILAFAFNASPTLITTFLGPVVANAFLQGSGWRWAFGLSASLFVVLSLPVLSILILNARKARKLGLLSERARSGPWTTAKLRQGLIDFDALGMFLAAAGLTLILVPFSLHGSAVNSVVAITPLFGVPFLVAFAVHERTTKRPFVRFSLLCSRNVAGAFLLSIIIFIAYFAWDGYYTSYLQVVHNLTVQQAGYIGHIYGLGSCIWAVVVGYLIRRTDRFKWLALAALPVHLLGGALMIVFRQPDTNIVWVIMCQILITIGGSTLVMCEQIAVMAIADHSDLASIMAILGLAYYTGSAIGSSLSGAIWNTTLPVELARLLPEVPPDELALIGSDLKRQLSYPVGSAMRTAIVTAYGVAQTRMCIAGTLISLFEILAVGVWQDVRVSQSKQVKGTVL
ncbi:putative siderophore iron transporter mirB [Daldinia caldariorum]|uniref:putative siderophore iron transporter mirB n=1 Tax=Daldinia caldariorum TaxID=326644 RepID=UPI0020073370|nr:putative siderophore iron transporter mirB [Daldinia caldariorum]KAI1465225.1 putative siderophore iron transporter mirB [Daldinia caldariorum]